MAEATCTAAGLVSAGACFTRRNFSRQEQLSILAYLSWKWADSADTSGSTYTTWDQLINGAKCITQGLTSDDLLIAAAIGILNRGEDGLGSLAFNAEVPILTADTAATAIACGRNADEHTLKSIIIFNFCRIFGEITS